MKLKRFILALFVNLPAIIIIGALYTKLFITFSKINTTEFLHFNWLGRPDRWGTPLDLIIRAVQLSLILLTSLIICYLWDQSETDRKNFNWLAVVMSFPMGLNTAILWFLCDRLLKGNNQFNLPWWPLAGVTGVIIALTAFIEWRRPLLANQQANPRPVESYYPQVQGHLHPGKTGKFAYWESQDPVLVRVGVVLLMVLFALISWRVPWEGLIIIPIFLLYGGFRIWVTSAGVSIRLGFLNIPLHRIPLGNIKSVSVHQFSPLKDFGGWGIRLGRNGIVCFSYQGNSGVLITKQRGLKILIGSDQPGRLAAVIQEAQSLAAPAR